MFPVLLPMCTHSCGWCSEYATLGFLSSSPCSTCSESQLHDSVGTFSVSIPSPNVVVLTTAPYKPRFLQHLYANGASILGRDVVNKLVVVFFTKLYRFTAKIALIVMCYTF